MADLKACNRLADSMYAENQNYEKLQELCDMQMSTLKQNEADYKIQIKGQEDIIKYIDSGNKKRDRKIKFQKIVIYVLGAFGIAELGYIGLQSLNPG